MRLLGVHSVKDAAAATRGPRRGWSGSGHDAARPGLAGAARLPGLDDPPPGRLRTGHRMGEAGRDRGQGPRAARRPHARGAAAGRGRRTGPGIRTRHRRDRLRAGAPSHRRARRRGCVDQPGGHHPRGDPRPGSDRRRQRSRGRARPVPRPYGRPHDSRGTQRPARHPGRAESRGPRLGWPWKPTGSTSGSADRSAAPPRTGVVPGPSSTTAAPSMST